MGDVLCFKCRGGRMVEGVYTQFLGPAQHLVTCNACGFRRYASGFEATIAERAGAKPAPTPVPSGGRPRE